MSTRVFLDRKFYGLGRIVLCSNADGTPKEYRPQERYKNAKRLSLHRYGHGPFCKFSMAKGLDRPGLYILTADDKPVYVGECIDVSKRWGPNGYGNIAPRNCYAGGQQTTSKQTVASMRVFLRKQNRAQTLRFGFRNASEVLRPAVI
ncbi:MAG: hypothetical protein GDA52_04560 [Rhodobacteraceae bacterium]|nr:hypothetical protein [Paracoccaceae bacterium]